MQEIYLQFKNLKRSDKYSLLLIGALLLCLLVKFAAIDTLQNKISAAENQLAAKREALNNYLAFANEHGDYTAFVKEQNEAALIAYGLVPQEINAAGLIKEYTELAAKYNLRLQSIKPIAPEKQKKESHQKMTFKITVTGSFYKAAAFLDELQNGKHLVSAANVALERSKDSFAGDVMLTADLSAYALK